MNAFGASAQTTDAQLDRAGVAGIEELAEALRMAVRDARWEDAAAMEVRLNGTLRQVLAVAPEDAATRADLLGTLSRIMKIYQSATRDALLARDQVRAELTAARSGGRAAADYLSVAGGSR